MLRNIKQRIQEGGPITYIKFAIGFFTIIGGLYLLSPFLDPSLVALNVSVPLIKLFGDTAALVGFGVLYLLSGIGIIWSTIANKIMWTTRFMFLSLVLRSFSIIGTIAIQGFLPLTWLGAVLVMVIIVIIYLYDRIALFGDK